MRKHTSSKHEALPREKDHRGNLKPVVYRATIGQRPLMFEPRPGSGWWDITNKLELGDILPNTLGFDELFIGGVSDRITDEIPLYELILDGGGRIALYAKDAHPAAAEYSYQHGSGVVQFPTAYTHSLLEIVLGGHLIAKRIHLGAGHESRFNFRLEGQFDLTVEGSVLDLGNGLMMPIPELTYAGPGPLPEERLGPQRLADWKVQAVEGGLNITLQLPQGDWQGWALDPSLILRPGTTEGKDSYTLSTSSGTNYGTSGQIQVTATGNVQRGYIQFNLNSIPEHSTFEDVSLETWMEFSNGTPSIQHQACDAAWVENAITWDNQPGVTGNVMATVTHLGTPASYALVAADFELLFSGNNYGWRLHNTQAGSASYVGSSDHGNAALRPELTVSYSPPAGRLAEYSLNAWDEDRKIIDVQGRRIPPNEVGPNKWLNLEGLDQPSAITYPSYIEDPTKILIVESRYKEGEDVPEIKSDRSQFGEVIMERVAGGSVG